MLNVCLNIGLKCASLIGLLFRSQLNLKHCKSRRRRFQKARSCCLARCGLRRDFVILLAEGGAPVARLLRSKSQVI